MKIYTCKELLRLPRRDKNGNPTGESLTISPGQVFTAEDGQWDVVRLEGTLGLRISLGRTTLETYFEELA